MTVTDQRNEMVKSLARIEEWQRNYELMSLERYDRHEKDHEKVIKRLDLINGRVGCNEKGIANIKGIGIGITTILTIAIGLVALLL